MVVGVVSSFDGSHPNSHSVFDSSGSRFTLSLPFDCLFSACGLIVDRQLRVSSCATSGGAIEDVETISPASALIFGSRAKMKGAVLVGSFIWVPDMLRLEFDISLFLVHPSELIFPADLSFE